MITSKKRSIALYLRELRGKAGGVGGGCLFAERCVVSSWVHRLLDTAPHDSIDCFKNASHESPPADLGSERGREGVHLQEVGHFRPRACPRERRSMEFAQMVNFRPGN